MARGVTPAGVLAGEPGALAGLIELRGNAVCAYANAVAEPDRAREAAAEAMAVFRAQVVGVSDVRSLDPDSMLLRAVRESSAARAPRPAPSGAALRRLAGRGGGACDLVPRLLAARANRELSQQDTVRLERHMGGCPGCRELRERFRAAETLYAEAAGTPPAEPDARALLLGLVRAAPLANGTTQSVVDDALALLADEPGSPAAAAAPPSDAGSQTGKEPAGALGTDAPPSSPADTPPGDSEPSAASEVGLVPPSREREPASAEAGPGGRVGTAPGRVSFGGRTPVTRPQPERPPRVASSAPSSPPAPERQPEPPFQTQEPADAAPQPEPPSHQEPADAAPQPEPPSHAQEPADAAPPRAAAPESEPPSQGPTSADAPPPEPDPSRRVGGPALRAVDERPHPPSRGDGAQGPHPTTHGDGPRGSHAVRPPARPLPIPASTLDGGPGAPPDSGTLARVVPGVLIVAAITIALIVAGVLGAGSTPVTSEDTGSRSLREAPRGLDATGTLGKQPVVQGDAVTDAD